MNTNFFGHAFSPPPRVTLSPFGRVLTPRIGICCTNPKLNGWNVRYSNEWDGWKKTPSIFILLRSELSSLPSCWPLEPLLFSPHLITSPLPLKRRGRSGSGVNLNFHKSHGDPAACFLSLLTQHRGRTWESGPRFWARTERLLSTWVCVFGAEEALLWGQSVAPVGLTSLWGRDVCPVQRSEGCNQTAGRLPRRLGSAGVDAGVGVCVCVSHPCIWKLFCMFASVCSPKFPVLFPAGHCPVCTCLASITRRNCLNAEMIAVGFEQ